MLDLLLNGGANEAFRYAFQPQREGAALEANSRSVVKRLMGSRGHSGNKLLQISEFAMSNADSGPEARNAADPATTGHLERDLLAVKNDIESLTVQITEALNALFGSTRKQAKSGSKQAGVKVDSRISGALDPGDAVTDAAYSIEETLKEVITDRPLAAVGIALGLGFLIGMTWRR